MLRVLQPKNFALYGLSIYSCYKKAKNTFLPTFNFFLHLQEWNIFVWPYKLTIGFFLYWSVFILTRSVSSSSSSSDSSSDSSEEDSSSDSSSSSTSSSSSSSSSSDSDSSSSSSSDSSGSERKSKRRKKKQRKKWEYMELWIILMKWQELDEI